MTIEKIQRDKCHTVRLFLSDKREISVDLDALSERGLFKGMEISEQALKELCELSDYLRTKSRALWYLDQGQRTEKQLRQKLRDAKFPSAAIDKTLEKLKEYSLIDDAAFTERFVLKCESANMSRRQIYCKLLEKGVSKEIIEAVLNLKQSEQGKIIALIERKYKTRLETKESREKLYAALVRKGFSFGDVKNAIAHFSNDDEFYGEY